jgi:GT2 family glycosyltransferase
MADIQLAVIINSFNRLDLLKMALPSLIDSLSRLPCPSAIFVFDAGSVDGSLDYIEDYSRQHSHFPIHLVTPQAESASSFADGCNQAIAAAEAFYPNLQWCFFYETDNQLRNPEALASALTFLQGQPRIGAVGFTVEKLDGSKTGYGCRIPSPLSFVLGQRISSRLGLDAPNPPTWTTSPPALKWTPCDVVFTSPLLVRFEAWKQTGPMDANRFPFTDSDLEWCWRAGQRGWTLAVLDLPGVIHDNGGAPSQWSARRVLWFHQSRMRLLQLLTPTTALIIRPLLVLRHLIEMVLLLPGVIANSTHSKRSFHTRCSLASSALFGYTQVR